MANLDAVVRILKKTGAVLIWCSTTPVSAATQGRVQGDVIKYNEAAAKVRLETLFNDVHWGARKRRSRPFNNNAQWGRSNDGVCLCAAAEDYCGHCSAHTHTATEAT